MSNEPISIGRDAPAPAPMTARLRELMEQATPGPWTCCLSWRGPRSEREVTDFHIGAKPYGSVYPVLVSGSPPRDTVAVYESRSGAEIEATGLLIEALVNNLPTIIRLLEAVEGAEMALAGVLPYMEEAETARLIGDEGCHWPVEDVRSALATLQAAREVKP